MSQTLGQWQRAGDPYVFSVILSPERSEQMDLQEFARRLVAEKMEPDLGVKLQWVAIQHDNTDHPHLHMVIRGLDAEGQQLWIDGSYLWGGIRQRARELATQMVGLRTQQEIDREREQAIKARGWTLLDKSINRKLPERVTKERSKPLDAHEVKRMFTLRKRGLAAFDAQGRWQLAEQWEEELKEEPGGREKEQKHAPEREKEKAEQERKQRVRIIDEHEHDDGWGR